MELLIDTPDYDWLMIDASHCKVHPDASGAVGANQNMSRTKGGSTQSFIWPWIGMVCRSGLLLDDVYSVVFEALNKLPKTGDQDIDRSIESLVADCYD